MLLHNTKKSLVALAGAQRILLCRISTLGVLCRRQEPNLAMPKSTLLLMQPELKLQLVLTSVDPAESKRQNLMLRRTQGTHCAVRGLRASDVRLEQSTNMLSQVT